VGTREEAVPCGVVMDMEWAVMGEGASTAARGRGKKEMTMAQ
jgi:hypothetical protein